MEAYITVGAFIIMIFTVYIEMYYKRRKYKTMIKSLEKSKKSFVFLSSAWFLLSFLRIWSFYEYETDTKNIDFTDIHFAIAYASVALILMLRAFQKDIINEYGICTSKGNYKWKRIINYEWDKIEEQIKVKEQYIKYYNLTFFITRTKFDRFFTGVNDKQVVFKIYKNNKDKVQNFLQDVVKLEDNNKENDS
jgi:hypothetical protein